MYIVQLYKEDWTSFAYVGLSGCSSPQYQTNSLISLDDYKKVNPSEFDKSGNSLAGCSHDRTTLRYMVGEQSSSMVSGSSLVTRTIYSSNQSYTL